MVMCVFGVISNVCMTILLTQPRLATTINRLLALVTLSDALLMCSYFVYVIHFRIPSSGACPVDMLTYGWVLFQLLHSNWSVYLRAFSLWLSVVMAGYRKRVLSKTEPHRQRKAPLAFLMALGVASAVFVGCIPIFLQNTIIRGPSAPENDTTCPKNHSPYYTLRPPEFALAHDHFLLKAAYWTNGLLLKLLPLSLLTYYLIRVVHLMYVQRQNRKRMATYSGCPQPARRISEAVHNGHSMVMPTTFVLVIILLTTVLCELPNAILSIMSGLSAPIFIRNTYIYDYMAEIMDLLSLFSCTSTSIFYFIMSQALRRSFRDTFCGRAWNIARLRSLIRDQPTEADGAANEITTLKERRDSTG